MGSEFSTSPIPSLNLFFAVLPLPNGMQCCDIFFLFFSLIPSGDVIALHTHPLLYPGINRFPLPTPPHRLFISVSEVNTLLCHHYNNLSNCSKYRPNNSTNIQRYCTVICTVENLFAGQVSACMQNCHTLPLSLTNLLTTVVGL